MRPTALLDVAVTCWRDGANLAFSVPALLQRLKLDGGIDTEGLTEEQIARFLNGEPIDDWASIVFACSEIIAFYVALEESISDEQLATCVLAACILADAARASECDWSSEHAKVVRICQVASSRMSLEASLISLRYIFGKGGCSPVGDGLTTF
ncbi:MAG: hypothetical protein IT580_14900 [Verrucomicrobiales bacterium]|nr:hypothetical protein [Verrucomicrobiales bacterium]